MKIYVVECGTFHSEGVLEDYCFKTKKQAQMYMRETYNCGFTKNTTYNYYESMKKELWYRIIELKLKENKNGN